MSESENPLGEIFIFEAIHLFYMRRGCSLLFLVLVYRTVDMDGMVNGLRINGMLSLRFLMCAFAGDLISNR